MMERLTFEGNFCDIAMCQDTPGGSFCEDGMCSQRKVWERLKEYEDTGLTPENIKELRADDVVEFAKVLRKMIETGQADRMAELAKADDEGRLVVLEKKEHQADVLQYYKHYRDRLEQYENALKGGAN